MKGSRSFMSFYKEKVFSETNNDILYLIMHIHDQSMRVIIL